MHRPEEGGGAGSSSTRSAEFNAPAEFKVPAELTAPAEFESEPADSMPAGFSR